MFRDDKENLRKLYQSEDTSDKVFIPARPKVCLNDQARIFRVCAYCRVSTDHDAQLSSFELQQAHYRQLVRDRPNWDLQHIYADEGISGTSLKNRIEFNAIIAACENGEYDLIVTKSVSRFAGNLVDCISLVRKLKNLTPPVNVINLRKSLIKHRPQTFTIYQRLMKFRNFYRTFLMTNSLT